MKLSDAMVLGATITELRAYHLDNCALGAAGNAVGVKSTNECFPDWRGEVIREVWPWLQNDTHWYHIAETFNKEVMETRSMTYEQLVEWVRSVEPACGECNQFECTCTPKAVTETPENVLAGVA